MHKKLYLIRHGETEGADAKRYKGHIDVPLSDSGIKQMERVSEFLVQSCSNSSSCSNGLNGLTGLTGLNAIYCSDLSRAVNSAEIIARPHGLEPVVMKDLKERNFGLWEGMSFDEIKEKYPDEFQAWVDDPVKFSPIDGENTIEVRDRAVAALDKILIKHSRSNKEMSSVSSMREHRTCLPDRQAQNTDKESLGSGLWTLGSENIAIVSHGGISRVILCHFLGIPLKNIFRIEQDFAAVNIIEFYDDYPVVKLINYRVPSKQPAGKQSTERRTQTGKIQNA